MVNQKGAGNEKTKRDNKKIKKKIIIKKISEILLMILAYFFMFVIISFLKTLSQTFNIILFFTGMTLILLTILVFRKIFRKNKACLFLCVLLLIGGVLNSAALIGNNFKMPFISENNISFSSASHQEIKDLSEARFPLLIDRFEFLGGIYSLGDIIFIISLIILILYMAFKRKTNKGLKHERHKQKDKMS